MNEKFTLKKEKFDDGSEKVTVIMQDSPDKEKKDKNKSSNQTK